MGMSDLMCGVVLMCRVAIPQPRRTAMVGRGGFVGHPASGAHLGVLAGFIHTHMHLQLAHRTTRQSAWSQKLTHAARKVQTTPEMDN